MPSQVPLEAQTLYCQACDRYTMPLSNYNSYHPYGYGASGNANFMSSNTYGTNPGYARSYQPRIVYQLQLQPHAHGRKRAVLCGITYKGHEQSLNGSINDVLYMKKLLLERCGFPVSSILVLTGTIQDITNYFNSIYFILHFDI